MTKALDSREVPRTPKPEERRIRLVGGGVALEVEAPPRLRLARWFDVQRKPKGLQVVQVIQGIPHLHAHLAAVAPRLQA